MHHVLAYADNVIVSFTNELEYKQHVLQLFQRLNDFVVSINVSNCEFGIRQIPFLDGIKPLPDNKSDSKISVAQ